MGAGERGRRGARGDRGAHLHELRGPGFGPGAVYVVGVGWGLRLCDHDRRRWLAWYPLVASGTVGAGRTAHTRGRAVDTEPVGRLLPDAASCLGCGHRRAAT